MKAFAEKQSRKSNSGVVRFRALVRRAQFDALLAADVARFEGLGDDLIDHLRAAYSNLNACLKRLDDGKDASR